MPQDIFPVAPNFVMNSGGQQHSLALASRRRRTTENKPVSVPGQTSLVKAQLVITFSLLEPKQSPEKAKSLLQAVAARKHR